jgi:hypothetical protein
MVPSKQQIARISTKASGQTAYSWELLKKAMSLPNLSTRLSSIQQLSPQMTFDGN